MNAIAHRTTAAATLSALSLALPVKPEQRLSHTLAAGAAGYAFGTLPDLLEPATSPNHRQFFHSVVFGGIVIGGLCKLYHWQPETDGEKILRWLCLAGLGAYLVHLVMDATTKRSLPLIGLRR